MSPRPPASRRSTASTGSIFPRAFGTRSRRATRRQGRRGRDLFSTQRFGSHSHLLLWGGGFQNSEHRSQKSEKRSPTSDFWFLIFPPPLPSPSRGRGINLCSDPASYLSAAAVSVPRETRCRPSASKLSGASQRS